MPGIDLGTVRPGTTLYIPFGTFDSNDPQASATITGLATTDIEVYKNGSTTQRASDSGFALLDTDGIDFDSITGVHGISIDLADNTDAGFYSAGAQYWVVIASITLDAATVNPIIATFRIGYPDAVINTTIATLASQTSFTLTSGPAEDDALNNFYCIIHDVASSVQLGYAVISDYTGSTKTVTLAAGTTFTAAATDNIAIMGPMPVQPTVAGRTLDISSTGEAGVDWANVGSPTTSLNLSGTTISTSQAVASVSGAVGSVTGAVGSVTGNVGGNVTGSVGSISGITFPTNFSDLAITVTTGQVTVGTNNDKTGYTASTVSDKTGYSLSAAQTFDLTGSITGNLSGSVGSVTGAVGSVTGAVGSVTGNVGGSIGSLGATAKSDVNAEVVDALATDTYAEPGQGAPAATTTLAAKINYLYKSWRNKKDNDGSTTNLYDDAGTTVDQKQTTSEAGGTVTKGEWATGP